MSTLLGQKHQDERLRWSYSFYVQLLVDSLNNKGISIQNEYDKDGIGLMFALNRHARKDRVILSQIGTLADACMMYEKRKNNE